MAEGVTFLLKSAVRPTHPASQTVVTVVPIKSLPRDLAYLRKFGQLKTNGQVMNYLTNRTEGDILVIGFRVASIVDRLSVTEVASEWMQELTATDQRKLIVDFSALEFLSSDVVGKLVELRTACMVKGVSLKICCLSDELKRVLSMTRLNAQFKIYATQRSAIECFVADNFVARQAFFARYATETDAELSLVHAAAAPTLELFPTSNDVAEFRF